MSRILSPFAPLMFFDCETGGLSASYHALLSFAYIVVDPLDINNHLIEKVILVKPFDESRISWRAASINGYTPSKWKDAIPEKEALEELCKDAEGCILVGHNVNFDWGFIQAALARHGMTWPGHPYKIDTVPLARTLVQARHIRSAKLSVVTEYLGRTQEHAHEAMSDTRDCKFVFQKLSTKFLYPAMKK